MGLRDEIAQKVCGLSDDQSECAYCKSHKGCPNDWPDVAKKVDSILALVATAVEKVENPYHPTPEHHWSNIVFEDARQAILKVIKEE